RLLALKDAVDVAGCLAILLDVIRPVGAQAAGSDEGALVVDRGQFVLGCELHKQIAMDQRPRAARHDQAGMRGARESCKLALDLAGIAHIDWNSLYAERRRRGGDGCELADSAGNVGIAN